MLCIVDSNTMKSRSGLQTVQRLYLMQVELQDLLEAGLHGWGDRRRAKERVREFSFLLMFAVTSYMGGQEVYRTLQNIERKVSERLRSPVAKRVQKKTPQKRRRQA